MTNEQILDENLEQAYEKRDTVKDLALKGIIPNYVSLLYTTLITRAPMRTGKLKASIALEYYGEDAPDGTIAKIIIAPGVPYARATNDNSSGPKQQYNYQWINNSVAQVSKVLADSYRQEGSIDYEIF
jgi:hypothetical protein